MMAQFSEYFEESEPIKPRKISIAAVVSKQDSKPSEKIELNSLHVEKTPIYEIVTGSILSIDEELTESSEHPSERPFRLLRSVSTIVNSVLGTMPDDSDSEKSTISRLASTPMSQVVEGILLNVMPDNPLQIEEVEEECELSGWKFPRKLTTKIEEEVTEECESDCEDPQMSQLILATKNDTVSDNTALKPQTHLDFPATRREKGDGPGPIGDVGRPRVRSLPYDLNDQLENLESTIQKLKANHLADLASLKQKLSELRDNVSEHEDEAATVQL